MSLFGNISSNNNNNNNTNSEKPNFFGQIGNTLSAMNNNNQATPTKSINPGNLSVNTGGGK